MGNYQVKENYIIKDEEADLYNMKGHGPFMVDSFGRKYVKPSVSYRTYRTYPTYNYPLYNTNPNMYYHRRGYPRSYSSGYPRGYPRGYLRGYSRGY